MTRKLYKEDGSVSALALVGPTASGKTRLSLSLAEGLGCEIVGCDSMQIYRYMDIGTAKPTEKERAAVPHHLFDFVLPNTPYSAADYAEEAVRCVRRLADKGTPALFCGGTGLYLEAARTGRHTPLPPTPEGLRERITRELTALGAEEAHRRLRELDPAAAEAIHPNNLRRVVRAFELMAMTGMTKTAWEEKSKSLPPALSLFSVCLYPTDREALRHRIDRRVEEMVKAGLGEEVELLMAKGYLTPGSTAAQAIGYKEYAAALRGECSVAEAIEEIKLATHRYARRQLTWFRAIPGIRMLPFGEAGPDENEVEKITEEARRFLEGDFAV